MVNSSFLLCRGICKEAIITYAKDTKLEIDYAIDDKKSCLGWAIEQELELKTTPHELIFWANTLGIESEKSTTRTKFKIGKF